MKNTKKSLIFLLKFKWDIFGGFSYTVELFIHTTAGNRKKSCLKLNWNVENGFSVTIY